MATPRNQFQLYSTTNKHIKNPSEELPGKTCSQELTFKLVNDCPAVLDPATETNEIQGQTQFYDQSQGHIQLEAQLENQRNNQDSGENQIPPSPVGNGSGTNPEFELSSAEGVGNPDADSGIENNPILEIRIPESTSSTEGEVRNTENSQIRLNLNLHTPLPTDSNLPCPSKFNLRTIQITQEHVDEGLQCMICHEDYVLSKIVTSLKCKHIFHTACIFRWLWFSHQGSCPVCRNTDFSPDEDSERNQEDDFRECNNSFSDDGEADRNNNFTFRNS